MKSEATESIRTKILTLAESRFDSDAAFERAVGLPDKTVNNWRRGKSSSFMKLLPELSELFGVNVGELMDIPLRRDSSELSEEELHLLTLYRKAHSLPEKMRHALRDTLETTINLYISSYSEVKAKSRKTASSKKPRE